MKIQNVTQGSDDWKALRIRYRVASEAPIIMGASSKVKRNELLHLKKTLGEREFNDWVQKNVIDKGHEYEAECRPLIETEIGEELYPVVAVDDTDTYLASFDGMPMSEAFHWEHKQWSEALAEMVRKGELDAEWYWQLEHQLLVDGAQYVLFTVSDGTPDRKVSMKYYPVPGRREQLIRGWEQWAIDLEAYIPVEEKAPIVARPVTELPAVLVEVNGTIAVKDNFTLFEMALNDFIKNRLIREPKTDQDFADLEAQIKSLKKAEDSLDGAEVQMLAQIGAIDAAKRRKDMLHELARSNRLMAEKLVKVEKENRKNQIVKGGQDAWNAHVATINNTLGFAPGGKIVLPNIPVNFAGVIKSLRTITSFQNAVDTELSRAKIEANRIADQMRLNIKTLRQYGEYEFLFADIQTIVQKAPEDFVALIKSRIAEHKEQERQKEERIREDERIKAEKAAKEKLEREQKAERERQAAEQKQPEPVKPAPAVTPAPPPVLDMRSTAPLETTPQQAPQRTPVPTQQARQRPSDAEFIQLVMDHYKVDKQTAIDWLMAFQFKAVG